MKPKKNLSGVFIVLGISILFAICVLCHNISFIDRTVNNKIEPSSRMEYIAMLIVTGVSFLMFSAAHIFATYKIFKNMPYNKNAIITQIFSSMFYIGGLVCAIVSFFFTPKETALLLIITQSSYVISAVVTCYVCKEADLI